MVLSESLTIANLRLTVPPLARLSSVTSARMPAVSPSAAAMAAAAAGGAAAGASGAVVTGAGAVPTDTDPVAARGAGEAGDAAGGGGSCPEHPRKAMATTSSTGEVGAVRFMK